MDVEIQLVFRKRPSNHLRRFQTLYAIQPDST